MRFFGAISALIAVCAVATACREVPHGSVMVDADASAWRPTDTLKVVCTNTDTVRLRDINFTASVERREGMILPLRIRCTSPDGEQTSIDRNFSTENAVRRATLAELSEPLLADVLLATEGDYVFEFIPAVTLEGVWAVGIEVLYGKR